MQVSDLNGEQEKRRAALTSVIAAVGLTMLVEKPSPRNFRGQMSRSIQSQPGIRNLSYPKI